MVPKLWAARGRRLTPLVEELHCRSWRFEKALWTRFACANHGSTTYEIALVWVAVFVLSALEFSQSRLPERRHITGRELAEACRDLALDRYGVMARLVLDHWGVRSTADIGDVVFTLVDLGLLISQPTDSRLDFADVFGFDQAFERDYPWRRAGQA